jgi:hypothetical protein
MKTIAEEILEKVIEEGVDVWDHISINPDCSDQMDDAGGDLAIFEDGSVLVWRGGSWEFDEDFELEARRSA